MRPPVEPDLYGHEWPLEGPCRACGIRRDDPASLTRCAALREEAVA